MRLIQPYLVIIQNRRYFPLWLGQQDRTHQCNHGFNCQEPGVCAFHCHVLTHAESPHGMGVIVTALIIK